MRLYVQKLISWVIGRMRSERTEQPHKKCKLVFDAGECERMFFSSRNILFLHCRNRNHRGAENDLLSVRFSSCHHRTTMKLYGFIFEVLGSCHWVEVIEQHGNTDCVCILYKLVSKYFSILYFGCHELMTRKGLENGNKLRWREMLTFVAWLLQSKCPKLDSCCVESMEIHLREENENRFSIWNFNWRH